MPIKTVQKKRLILPLYYPPFSYNHVSKLFIFNNFFITVINYNRTQNINDNNENNYSDRLFLLISKN